MFVEILSFLFKKTVEENASTLEVVTSACETAKVSNDTFSILCFSILKCLTLALAKLEKIKQTKNDNNNTFFIVLNVWLKIN